MKDKLFNISIDTEKYQITGLVSESRYFQFFKGRRRFDNQPIFVKTFQVNQRTEENTEILQNEYNLLNTIFSDFIFKPIEFQIINKIPLLILEGFESETFEKHSQENDFIISKWLTTAICMTNALKSIHSKGIIHKNLNPDNIFWNKKEGICVMGDLSMAQEFNSRIKNKETGIINDYPDNPAYMSPEQTGRVNNPIDYRSDYYSLGIILYKLATKILPFDSSDISTLVHWHIAKTPMDPHSINPEIPEVISEIIQKLLSKNPDARYQSSQGLLYDLEKCQLTIKNGQVPYFKIGSNDTLKNFHLSEQLFGRESEIETLYDLYNKSVKGQRNVVYIAGISGIGKTSLVEPLLETTLKNNGRVIQGKFNYQTKGIPFKAITQAFADFLDKFQSESGEEISSLKHSILDAVGKNGQIIIDVIPELEKLIGPQPPIIALPAVESQNRFNHIFQNFIKVFATKEHPLVFFLDDLQWADTASLSLMHGFLSESDLSHFLFLGSYRSESVKNDHPLHQTLEKMENDKISFFNLNLKPITEMDTRQFISETFHKPLAESIQLTNIIYRKTNGVPFLIKEFLRILHSSNLLHYHSDEKNPEKSGWDWDTYDIEKENFSDNIYQLLTEKISDIPPGTIHIMKIGACFGIRFNVDIVSEVLNQSAALTLEKLKNPISQGLLTKNKNYIYFSHDQILEATYALLNQEEKSDIHYKVGKILLNYIDQKSSDDQIFNFLHQWNHAKKLLSENESNLLIHLNYEAGIKAKKSSAYQASSSYFQHGAEILSENSWETDYPFTFSFYREWAESEYLARNFEKAEELFDISLSRSAYIFDNISIYSLMIQYYITQIKPVEALDVGLGALKQLGVSIPENPGKLSVAKEFIKSRIILFGKKTEKLINLPVLEDKKLKTILNLMIDIIPPALISKPDMAALLILKVVNISLRKGISGYSVGMIVNYGSVISAVLGNVEKGFEFMELGNNLLKKYHFKESPTSMAFAYNATALPFKMSFQKRQPKLESALSLCLEYGNFQYYGYVLVEYMWSSFYIGENLQSLLIKLSKYQKKVQQFKQPQTDSYFNVFFQAIENLAGQSRNRVPLIGNQFNEEITIPLLKQNKDNAGITWFKVLKVILHFLIGDKNEGLAIARTCEKEISGLLGLPITHIFYFYYGLLLASNLTGGRKDKRKDRLKLKKIEKKYKKLSLMNSENFLNKYLLIKAEILRIEGKDFEETSLLYEKAIDAAATNNLIHEEAMANELASEFYSKSGLKALSRTYRSNAYDLYSTWGCRPKLEIMQSLYPEYRKTTPVETIDIPENYPLSRGRAQLDLSILDLNSILKTSYALSQEISIEELLKKLMLIVSTSGGAEKGLFLFLNNNEWVIDAAYTGDQNEVLVMKSTPIVKEDGIPLLPTSILEFVEKHKKTLTLEDASHDPAFSEDLYIKTYKARSILCMPLLIRGNIIGIIYLENNLLSGCFTKERIDLLKILSGNIAVSVNNALLYKNLDQKVRERTHELEIERNKLKDQNLTMEQDINLARKIQYNLIPGKININYISHIYKSKEALGGDFFDVLQFPDSDKIGIFLSDVSGHGLTAAFITSMIKTILLQAGDRAKDTGLLLLYMNEVLQDLTSGNFITVFYGIYDPIERSLEYSSAGHNNPLLIYNNTVKELSGGRNTAISVLSNEQLINLNKGFQKSREILPEGSKLLIYTDGLVDAKRLGDGELFEDGYLNKCLIENQYLPSHEFTRKLFNELIHFRGSDQFDDDVCFLCMDITSSTALERTYKFKAGGIEIRKTCLDLDFLMKEWHIEKLPAQDIVLAVDEALTNIMEHGYKNLPGTIILDISKHEGKITISIKDFADPYTVDQTSQINKETYVKSDQVGGFGISLITRLMGSVTVIRKDNQNILTMTKYI